MQSQVQETRNCSFCKNTLPLSADFFCRDKSAHKGFSYCCRECNKKNHKKRLAKRLKKVGKKRFWKMEYQRTSKYYEENPEKKKEHEKRIKEWRQTPNGVACVARTYKRRKPEYMKRDRQRNRTPEGRRKRRLRRQKYLEDYGNKIVANLRSRLAQVVRGGKSEKSGFVKEFVGCSRSELKMHFERFWKHGMSWSNYGRKSGRLTWHIDHIVPCFFFKRDFDSKESKKIKAASRLVNHYTNLFPLWGAENLSKLSTAPKWTVIENGRLWSDLHEKYYGPHLKQKIIFEHSPKELAEEKIKSAII